MRKRKPNRPMSMSEYTRYWDSYKQAAEATGKGYQSRDPRIEGNTVRVATGGKVTSRTKLELFDFPEKKREGTYQPKGTLPGGKPEGKYQPKGDLPGGKPGKKDTYKGYKKGGTSPSTYGKRP